MTEEPFSIPDTYNTTVFAPIEYNNFPGIFIFVLNQSGSMQDKMHLVIDAMLLFIQSLPKNSYFDIYGFGSLSKHYSKKLEANLGGTKALLPLQ